MSPDQLALLDLAEKIQDLLRSAHGEGRDDDVSAAVQGFLDPGRQFRHIVYPLGTVQPVTVGGFDHQIIRLLHMLRVLQDRLVGIAHISAEAELPGYPFFLQPDLNRSGAQQMAHIRHADADRFVDLDPFAVGTGAKLLQDSLGVFHGIDRLGSRGAAALGLSVFPFRFRLLDVCAVTQHDLTQGAGGCAGIDRSAVSFFIQQRQHPGMVDMCMGKQHEIQFRIRNRQRLVLKQILPLLHAEIYDSFPSRHRDQRAGTRNLVCRTVKSYLHRLWSPSVHGL